MGDNEAETKPMTRRLRILVINPNSNEAVTEGLRQAVLPLTYAEGPEIACTTLTEGPYGIETQEHADSVTVGHDVRFDEILAAQLDAIKSEFGGGILLALGLLSPLGSLAIIGAMLVAVATVHLAKGFWAGKGGFEFNLSLIVGAAAIAFTGAGTYSLDNALGIHLPEPLSLIAGTIALIVGVTVTLASRSPQPDTQTQTA